VLSEFRQLICSEEMRHLFNTYKDMQATANHTGTEIEANSCSDGPETPGTHTRRK